VKKSLADYKRRLPEKQIRPWLQDFFGYTAKSVQAQIKAAKELGYEEYLIWNAGNRYTEAALKDNSKLVPEKGKVAFKPVSPADAKT
jgi:xylose isomerase